VSGDDTPDEGLELLAGYEPGFRIGYRIGMARALECFQRALIESGTEVGAAYLLAERLRRWIAANGG
jgi:hypothetical protein